MMKDPLSRTEAHAYWVARHETRPGKWDAVGYQSGDAALNQAFYECRMRALRQSLVDEKLDLTNKRVLDVGCGLGTFSRYYHSRGAQVFGVDVSPKAVEHCNSLGIGQFTVCEAGALRSHFDQPFDLIHCFDVLYHITDDNEWETALGGYAGLSHSTTRWLLTEFHVPNRHVVSAHVVKRSVGDYDTQLAKFGWKIKKERAIFGLHARYPGLVARFPALMPLTEPFGTVLTRGLSEWVALWTVRQQDDT